MAMAVASSVLVGRDRELVRLSAALDAARSGAGACVVLEGEAGIGKSALLVQTRMAAEDRGMGRLEARGSEAETDYAFGVVRQLLEPVVRTTSTRERKDLFAGAASLAAPLLLDAPVEGEPASIGVLHGLYWVVAGLAERRPLLLAIDDAHWVDEPSLQFATYLARRLDTIPVALVVATRRGGAADELATSRPDVVSLGPLAPREVAEVLDAATASPVDDAFVQACHHASGGNPFLLTELVRVLRENGVPFNAAGASAVAELTPPQVARSTRAQLARLGPAAIGVARARVVLGDDAPLDLVAELAGLSRRATLGAVDALAGAALFDATEPRFRHPLLRSAVAAGLSSTERETLHRHALSLLRSRGARPERLAMHLLPIAPSGEEEDRRTLHAAALRTVEQGAPAAAVPLFRRLLDEPLDDDERASVLLELGRAEYGAGALSAAADHLEDAYAAAREPLTRGRALELLIQASSVRTRKLATLAEDAGMASDALEGLDRELALRLRAQTLLGSHRASPTDEQLAELARLPGDTPAEAVVLGHLVFRRTSAGATAAEVGEIAERAARQIEALAHDGTRTTAFSGVVIGLRWADRLDAAERVLDRSLPIVRLRGSAIDFANCTCLRAEVYVRRGMLREAEAEARAAQAVDVERSWWFARGLNPLLQSLVGQGRSSDAVELLNAELGNAVLPDVPPMLSLMLTRASVRAAAGDHAGALAEFEEAVRRRGKWGGLNPSWIADLLIAADSHLALGNVEPARRLQKQARTLAVRWGTPGALGQVARAEGVRRQGESAIAQLRESVSLLERSPARLELARSLVDLGSTLRRAGKRSDSREPLRTGYDLAQQCGAVALAENARYQLAASGIRVRRERLTGVDALTASERRIADFAAGGGTNAEISQALFVTVKTVEMHLTHVYRKLGISGRGELAAALGR